MCHCACIKCVCDCIIQLLPNEDDQNKAKESYSRANLAHLMRIAIEMPEKLPDDIVESVVDIWNRKTRRIAV